MSEIRRGDTRFKGSFDMYELIKAEPKATLLSIDYIERLALAVSGLKLSRRKTPDWLASTIFGWIEHGGVIVDSNGSEIEIDDEIVERAHGQDGSFACISALKRAAGRPRRRRPRASMLLRLQLYDAAFKIIGRPIT